MLVALLPRRKAPLRIAFSLATLVGCRCSRLEAEVDGQKFMRCLEVAAPAEREVRAGRLRLRQNERTLHIEGRRPLTLVAFAGPVGETLDATQLGALRKSDPALLLFLGGLGDTEQLAEANLRALAGLDAPVLFLAGGADRLELIEAAFAALDEKARERVWHISGVRELDFGADRFVVIPGAALGRYAADDGACGFAASDLDTVRSAFEQRPEARTWLLSWHAPAGFGVSESFGRTEVGSADLRALAVALSAKGGVFAFPEGAAGDAASEPFALVVPRMGRMGSLHADGSHRASGFARFVLGPDGPVGAP